MAIEFQGVNLSGLEFGRGDRPWFDYAIPQQSHYDYWAQDVGMNIVRIPFKWERLQAEAGGDINQEYLDFLKESVSHAQANDMVAILDLHNYGSYSGQKLDDMVDGAGALTDVRTKLGNEFAGQSDVWLNLMNEPNGISIDDWAALTQETVNNLRAEGIEHKLLVSGSMWSGAFSWINTGNGAALSDFTDPLGNYAFDVHQYLDEWSTGTTGQAFEGMGESALKSITAWAEAFGHELFLGEIGLANPDVPGQELSVSEMEALMEFMNAHSDQWLGYALWGAGPWWPGDYHFNINPDYADGVPVAKEYVQDFLDYMSAIDSGNIPDDIDADNPDGDGHDDPFFDQDGDTFISAENGSIYEGDAGIDTVDYSLRTEAVSIWLNYGMGNDGASDGDQFVNIENVIGTNFKWDHIWGDSGSNVLRALDGNDKLEGLEGADVLDGGEGWDYSSYVRSDAAVHVDLQTGYSRGGHAEGDRIVSIEAIDGSKFNDIFYGDDTHNYINGLDGDDLIYGRAGNDKLLGSHGDDIIHGGIGDDRLYGGEGEDVFIYGFLSHGHDKIYDLEIGEAGDTIDLSSLLSHYDADTDAIANFIDITQNDAGHAVISVNVKGTGDTDGFTDIITIVNHSDLLITDLISQGNLIL